MDSIFPNAHEEGINEEDEDLYDVDLESPFNGNENEEDITFQYLNEGCHIHSSDWKDPPSEKIFIETKKFRTRCQQIIENGMFNDKKNICHELNLRNQQHPSHPIVLWGLSPIITCIMECCNISYEEFLKFMNTNVIPFLFLSETYAQTRADGELKKYIICTWISTNSGIEFYFRCE